MEKIDRLIEEHIPRLRRYARALVGDRARADDLVQDTLETRLGQAAPMAAGSDLRAWLFYHHAQRACQRHQEKQCCARCCCRWMMMPGGAGARHPGRRAAGPGSASALGRLPHEQREVLLLVGLEEMSYEEVAKVLDVPLGTVMSRLSRGRERLRQIMAGGAVPALRVVK